MRAGFAIDGRSRLLRVCGVGAGKLLCVGCGETLVRGASLFDLRRWRGDRTAGCGSIPGCRVSDDLLRWCDRQRCATPIAVRGGDHVQADIHLNPVPALHLFVRAPTEATQSFNMPLIQQRVFDSPEFVPAEGAGSVAPGVMELVGIPAGKYSVTSRCQRRDGVRNPGEMNLTKDGQELEVPPSEPSGTVKVSVKMARGEPLPKD